MSANVLVTPRKRKAADLLTPGKSSLKEKLKGPPTPNPPLIPFPTPPRSRHRKDPIAQPDFLAPSRSLTPPPTPSKRKAIAETLPSHLQSLLTLHHAFNLALSLHNATHPPVLPPHPSTATTIHLTTLTNFLAIRDTVERSSGRRFGLPELGRLAWIWAWDGRSLPDDKVVSEKRKKALEEDNPFLVPTTGEKPSTSAIHVSGLGYTISPTRTLENGRKVYTYGLGIELDLKPGETRQILHGGIEGGLGNKGIGGGTAAIGRWSAGGEVREEVFRERLERWVELNGGLEPAKLESGLPTPSTSSSGRSSIPPIPTLPLPRLPSSTPLPSANLFSALASSSTSSPTSSPRKPSSTSPAGLSDPFVLDEKKKVIRPGSVEERKQAMMDRIKARSKPVATLGSSVGMAALRTLSGVRERSAAEQQEELKRRSTLSRLEGIAEGVWMMFSAPSPGPSTLPTPPRGRRKAIPVAEVAEVVVKSSKTPISTAEAITSLKLLTSLCPFFLTVKTIAKQEWLEMPSALALSACPTSPGSGDPDSLVGVGSSPSRIRVLPEPPSSPTPGSSSRLAGAASPGRVRRVGGLREVRERIRRELGE